MIFVDCEKRNVNLVPRDAPYLKRLGLLAKRLIQNRIKGNRWNRGGGGYK